MPSSSPDEQIDIAVVGLGPAGIAIAHRLSELTDGTDISCFEMGPRPESQKCPVLQNSGCLRRMNCHILTGFGGASLLSGGKLSTLPAGSSLIEITGDQERVDQTISESLHWFNKYLEIEEPSISEDEIMTTKNRFLGKGFDLDYYDAHLMTGTEEAIIDGYSKMCSDLEQTPISIQFNSTVSKIQKSGENYTITVENGNKESEYRCEKVVLAVGMPGKSLLDNLDEEMGVVAQHSKLEIGVRLEFPIEIYPEINEGHNDLKLHRGSCRTFCVCKGGQLAPYYHDGVSLLDGHVNRSSLTNLTNLGIRLRLPPQPENERIYEQIRTKYRNLSNGVPIRQSYSTFIDKSEPSINDSKCSMSYWKPGDINELFPEKFGEELRENVQKFVDTVIPEQRQAEVSVYAPGLYYPGLEFEIDTDFSIRDGLYIIGEGTGQFRGILQAFSSGLLCAESIAEDH